jgi:UDP-N-acetylmuramoyl-tripeptide--D-alanyl-D-alanine ligase
MMFLKTKNYLHILQLEGYNSTKFKAWSKQNKIMIYKNNKSSKKPLVYTARIKRLMLILYSVILLGLLISTMLVYFVFAKLFSSFNASHVLMSISTLFMLLFYFTCIYHVFLANCISSFLENKINKSFYNNAKEKINKLGDNGLITIGVTGSYGKTSVKFISSAILSQKFRVLNTPESYNTPMGISKVINNDLNEDHEVFIAEMGATKIGDIKELTILTNPQIGLLTSIGVCHLESFGSIKNVASTKYELIEGLADIGVAIFNNDNSYLRALAEKTEKKKLLYAIENIKDADIYAKEISVNEEGSYFTLCIREKGSINCKTSLLGKHNILNILAAVSIAHVLGMNLNEISTGIKEILPVKHRLELIDPKTGILVIDDAYNSNPNGAEAALDVINEFKDRRKIIVTPGMVELGDIEKEENEKFGEKIAKVCDIAILVGKKRTEPIYKGLLNSGFDRNNIYVVNSTSDSTEVIKKISKQGDVVLYENDLPDIYEENVN